MDRIYTERDERTKVGVNAEPKQESLTGIRKTLRDMGFSDKSIGYDNKSGAVTLNGRKLMTPSYLDDEAGVSYAKASDIQKSVVDYFKDSKNPVVRVSDAYAAAAGEYGLAGNGLSYGNGTVSIGGMPLDVMYIDDSGKAWARQSDVYDLVQAYADNTGVESPNSIAERYEREYLSDITDRINKLENREEFSYDPDSDPVYIAYRNKYMRESDRAGRDAMASYSAQTGGYTNSAAVTAGALANQYYAQQLTDTIPALAEQAYRRYYDAYQMDAELIGRLVEAYETAYNNAMDANEMTADNARYAANSIVDRDSAEYEKMLSEHNREWEGIFNEQSLEDALRDGYWTDVLNSQQMRENELDSSEKEIFLEYYRRILEAQIEGEDLDNKKTRAEISAKYGL